MYLPIHQTAEGVQPLPGGLGEPWPAIIIIGAGKDEEKQKASAS
ncbi:hypothetical protein [Rufibacter latericius]|nr:hypothetical protein [Rufibacter latericius]